MSEFKFRRFQCHKIVHAEQIDTLDVANATIGLKGGEIHTIMHELATRIQRMATEANVRIRGGYLVRYDDGYLSFSPEKVFNDGYFEIPDDDAEAEQSRVEDHLDQLKRG